MIIDHLENSALYEPLNPLFKKAFDYLKSLDFTKIDVGKTQIEGNDLYVSVSNSTLKTKENAKLEVHDNYIDIQIPVSKAEGFGWIGRKKLKKETAPYNPEKDIRFFDDQPQTYFSIEPGNFAVFFPEDGHAPCIGDGSILKIVVKVKVK
jgi:YhcH/YjgK/YiaL family protein